MTVSALPTKMPVPPAYNHDSGSSGGAKVEGSGSAGERWQSWIRSKPDWFKSGLAASVGAIAGGVVGLPFGPIGAGVGAVAGAGLLFFATKAMSAFT